MDNPVEVATAAFVAGISVAGVATALALDNYELDPDAADFGIGEATVSSRRLERLVARAEALEQMRLHRPAQWAKLVSEEEWKERQEALDSRLPRDTWMGFFQEMLAHQSNILSEDEMGHWIIWVKDLAQHRFPAMA